MQIEIFTLSFNPEQKKFDTTELDEFKANKKITSFCEHLIVQGGETYWLLLLAYEEKTAAHDFLPSQERLWEMLKEWRREQAKKEKHQSFIVMHDRELREIVRRLPDSAASLKTIHGIGEAKTQKYAEDILKVIARWRSENQGATVNPSPAK